MHPKLLEEHSSLVRAASREYISVVQAGFERIARQKVQLGALDFGMVVDGSVVMVENIMRHVEFSQGKKTILEVIATAAHEVQKPVFFARIIIIVSYLPIFTLQRVEGRLFRPMAWTVAFALLGALLFALLIAPVLCHLV